MQEFAEANTNTRCVAAINKNTVLQKSDAVNPKGLTGALWSEDEMIVEARVALERLPAYLQNKYGVCFYRIG